MRSVLSLGVRIVWRDIPELRAKWGPYRYAWYAFWWRVSALLFRIGAPRFLVNAPGWIGGLARP